MYPAYRKIKKAGGIKEEQLGYECQTKGCNQPRVKAEVIFEQITDSLTDFSGVFSKKEFQKYLIAVHHFTQVKSKELKSEKGRVSKALGRMKTERSDLIKQRAILLSKDLYDDLTRDELEPRIQQL